jgi:histidine triad (HIT) family protein
MHNCIFCDIIEKKLPAYIVYEDDDVLAILPKEIEVYGHTLVMPKQHYENILNIDEATLHKVISVVQKLSLQYQKTI